MTLDVQNILKCVYVHAYTYIHIIQTHVCAYIIYNLSAPTRTHEYMHTYRHMREFMHP